MADRRLKDYLRHLKPLLVTPPTGEWTDCQLLERYANEPDEAAFASLVRRHASLVLGVGRRVLHHDQDAEDVFQATFILLSRKAASSRWQTSIAGWLYCVAYRLALRTRTKRVRQRAVQRAAGIASGTKSRSLEAGQELLAALDEELNRLSEQCREPLLLCYLEGKTRDQAARQLGWSLRTLERRLQRALKLLRARLSKRGVELPMALLALGLSQQAASAGVSGTKIAATVEAAKAGGAIPDKVAALIEGGLKAMTVARLKTKAVMLLAACVMFAGVCAIGHPMLNAKRVEENQAAQAKTASTPQAVVWPEGATVKGRVVDHRGVLVPDAEILLLGEEQIIVDAVRRNWFDLRAKKDRSAAPSTRTNRNGEFRIERKKGTADRLVVIAKDPLLWVVPRKSLTQDDNVEIRLPAAGSLAIHCDLPGKADKQPVDIELRSIEGMGWSNDILRFHSGSFSVVNPGETVFKHLPPGQYVVQRYQETLTGRSVLHSPSDRQLAKVEPDKRATIRFERKVGRPLTGRVRGLENVALRYAHVSIMYAGPEEQFEANGRRGRMLTAFEVIPIKADGKFTTDPIPPGEYTLFLFAVRASTPEQSSQQSDFNVQLTFKVPEQTDMPKVEAVAKPLAEKNRQPNTDPRVRVVDETGKPIPVLQATIQTAGGGPSAWMDGGSGVAGLSYPSLFTDAGPLEVAVRADGYATSLLRIEEGQRDKLRRGEPTVTMRRGQKVELRFRLPEGMTWPEGALPETYFNVFEDHIRIKRQPSSRRPGRILDYNMLNVRAVDAGRFELRLAPDTPPFQVAVHVPGFLRYFEAGPFTLADAKEGVLEVAVPRPANLDVRFDPGQDKADKLPFKGAWLQVLRQLQGDSYLVVATEDAPATGHKFKLTDLSPGNYLVSVRTQPKSESKQRAGTEINLGSYFDQKKLVLEAGQSERVDFRREPFDPNAFRGRRTAVLRIRMADGSPAVGREVKVEYQGGHYGAQVVFSGKVPKSGEVTLKALTDRVPSFCPNRIAYAVTVGRERVGHFGFTKDGPTQEFEFHLAPTAGDPAPDVVLRSVATGKTMKLSSLRGKLVCLEFWATWCGPCQPAMEKLSGLSAEHGSAWKDRVILLPVSIDTSVERVKTHVSRRGWDRLDHFWTSDETATGFDAPAARAFGVFSVPETILIGPDGKIIWRGHPLDTSGGQDLRSRIESERVK